MEFTRTRTFAMIAEDSVFYAEQSTDDAGVNATLTINGQYNRMRIRCRV